jgi:predicted acyltransferase
LTAERAAAETTDSIKSAGLPPRLLSLDAYRGFVMLLMASEGLRIGRVAQEFPDSTVWGFLAEQTEHVAWVGCSLWDLIQPSFMFMVGVALPFSIASRVYRGQTFGSMLGHAIWRSVALIALGIFLRSVGQRQTNFTFEDVLTQIGLGYPFLFLLGWVRNWRVQLSAACLILVGYWAAFAMWPLPPAGFDYQSVGVSADWKHLEGFAAHWDKNTNLAAAFDEWFLNLFPRQRPFVFNGGGYLTLSFIPSLATMILGLLAGQWLRSPAPALRKCGYLAAAGAACLVIGFALNATGICPVVKRIWTPSWTIFAAGWTCLLLAAFYAVIDLNGHRAWAFPLVVVGMNSIAMYCMAHLFDRFIGDSFRVHLGREVFELFGAPYAPMVQQAAVLLTLWLICWWMYRRKLFLKI